MLSLRLISCSCWKSGSDLEAIALAPLVPEVDFFCRLERLRELYLSGDIEKDEFQSKKVSVVIELAELPTGTEQNRESSVRLAKFVSDLAAAWELATPAERD
ncbi:MAG TPA: hypothetical protein VFP05_07275 [Thermomicrobiales bacterium]|nr:hypothetical protein [Thermomicrobiales bacterium]